MKPPDNRDSSDREWFEDFHDSMESVGSNFALECDNNKENFCSGGDQRVEYA